MMLENAQKNINTKIDWYALDGCWAEQYNEDYGNLFSKKILNNNDISISVLNHEAGILVWA